MSFWKFWKKPHSSDVAVTVTPEEAEGVEVPEKLEEAVEQQMQPEEPEMKNIKPLDLMKVKYVDSPNKSARKDDIKYIVLHHTGPGSFNGIVNWLTNRDARASAHYVVGTAGQVAQLVNTKKKAWHAGVSKWDGLKDINRYSIGIEICNLGVLQEGDDGHFYYEQGRALKKYTGKAEPVEAEITFPSGNKLKGYAVPYPEKQIDKTVALCKALVEKYPQIKAENIITHYDIGQPEGRKNDPFGLDIDMIRKLVFYNG